MSQYHCGAGEEEVIIHQAEQVVEREPQRCDRLSDFRRRQLASPGSTALDTAATRLKEHHTYYTNR